MLVTIMYDIKDSKKRSKVLEKVFKTCSRYLYHLQFSVFYGELNRVLIKELEDELKKIINPEKDSVMIIKVPNKNNAITNFLGKKIEISNFIFD